MKVFKTMVALALCSRLAGAEAAPEFELVDVNLTSPRSGELISPRDYRHQVTAYYFGDPT